MGNEATIRRLYDAFAQGDVPTVLGGMDPKIGWSEAEGNPYSLEGKAWIGGDQVLEHLFMKFATQWDGFSVHPKDFYSAGDVVVVEGRYTGTFTETGKSLDAQFCHVFKLKDDKVTRFQQFTDTAQWQAVMGPTQR